MLPSPLLCFSHMSPVSASVIVPSPLSTYASGTPARVSPSWPVPAQAMNLAGEMVMDLGARARSRDHDEQAARRKKVVDFLHGRSPLVDSMGDGPDWPSALRQRQL